MDDPWIVLGKLVKPQGLKGEVRVRSEIADPENFFLPGLRLRRPDGSLEMVEVESYRRHKGVWILRLAGHSRIGEIEPLIGSELVCRSTLLPPPAEDEYYHYELLQLEVFDASGCRLGRLCEIISTPGHDVLVIRPEESVSAGQELLLPMVAAYVLAVDREKGRIIVDPDGRGGGPATEVEDEAAE